MNPIHPLPTCADHLLRLLELTEAILDACELNPDDVGEAGPFARVAELLRVAEAENDLDSVRRLTAALDCAAIIRESRETEDVDELAGLVERAEGCLARMRARRLEVVDG